MKQILLLFVLAVSSFAAQDHSLLKGRDIGLFLQKGRLVLTNGKGVPLLFLDKLKLMWSSPVFLPEKARELSQDRLEVSFRTLSAPEVPSPILKAQYTIRNGNMLKMEYFLSDSGNLRLGGSMQEMNPAQSTGKVGKPFKSGLWTRDAKGGVPFETGDGTYRIFQGKTEDLWLKLSGNPEFTNPWSEHMAFRKTEGGYYAASMEFAVFPSGTAPVKAAALFHGRPAALEVATGRDFNLWSSGKPEFTVRIYNTSGKELASTLNLTVRDFDGRTVLSRIEKKNLSVDGTAEIPCTIPEEKRGIYFVEASLNVSGKEFFTRTNLAVLPEYKYISPETSRIGMAAFFPIPNENAVFRLMKRIGVRYLRNGDNRITLPRYGIISLAHSNLNPNEKIGILQNKAEAMLDKFEQQNNPAWEFGNEWNMRKSREEKIRNAEKYSDLIKALAKRKQQKNARIRLLSMGIAGPDIFYLEQFRENGIWDLLDGIVIHPGRGHFTADYDNPKEFWCYLGAIRKVREFVKKYGRKPIYLSEVYAATPPNSRWNDSLREAADNTFLTLVLAVAEGVELVEFYQMHDGVWFNHGGVNPKNSEYHYGLLLRDGAPKPSLLAFAAAAEALDGAKFIRFLSRPGTKLRGLLFETPRGPMAILYDRTDGFHQAKLNPKQLEPWVNHWKTNVKTVFESDRKDVTVLDVLGRGRMIPVNRGKVELELNGSPLVVYGLKF